MGIFNVELKKVIDESYEIEIGFGLEDKLICDIQNGLAGNVTKFAVISDSVVKDLYAVTILNKLISANYHADLFVFDAGEVNKTRKTKTGGQKDDVIALLKKVDLPTAIPSYIDRDDLVKNCIQIKKVKNGQLRFVIQNGIGNVVEFDEEVYATKIEGNVAREIILNM